MSSRIRSLRPLTSLASSSRPGARSVHARFGSLLVCALVSALSLPAGAAEPAIFRMADRATALEGEREGVGVDAEGRLRLAPRLERLVGIDEPFVFSAATIPGARDGAWLLGTGNEGKVFRVEGNGAAEMLVALPEPEVFAVLGREDGSLLAASSPEGKVYRVSREAHEVLFDAEATYIWDLAEDRGGELLVATGLPGRLWRVDGDGKAEVLFESPDRHVRTIFPHPDGSIWIGTAGRGLIVRIGDDGVQTLYDGAEPEVLAFASDGKGSTILAALLASEASYVDLSNGEDEEAAQGNGVAEMTIGSRSGGHSGPRSVLVAIEPAEGEGADGRVRVRRLAQLDDQTVHDLAFVGDRLFVATGQEGRLFGLSVDRVFDGNPLVREAELDERQLVAIVPGPRGGAAVVTTDGAAVYGLHAELRAEGTFQSPILDAGALARFGNLRWRGHLPPGTDVIWRLRAGMAAEPDATWTDWQELPSARSTGGTVDRELALDSLGSGRYLQWQARLKRGAVDLGPVVDSVEVSYQQLNRPPVIAGIEVLDPGKILVAQNFNPSSTTFEPWSPNRDGIFTTLRQEKDNGSQKELWKKGYRTLRWEALDPNDDTLRYGLEVRSESDTSWLPMVENLEDDWYSFDSTVLPDGLYRFRLRAGDGESNPPSARMEAFRTTGAVTIDHSPPVVGRVKPVAAGYEVEVRDALVPLRAAVYSIDAGPWQPAEVLDGLLDGRSETLLVRAPEGARLVLLRLTDAAHNVVTSRLASP